MQTFGNWSRDDYYLFTGKNYATYYVHEAVFICCGKKIHRIEIEGSTWLNIYGHTSPDRIYFFKGQNDESSVMS